jgi:hypothetical protein
MYLVGVICFFTSFLYFSGYDSSCISKGRINEFRIFKDFSFLLQSSLSMLKNSFIKLSFTIRELSFGLT